ncbi:helix-turn-helix domain-containing protein [Pseudobacillus wudalianchiensis]|uniref:helix-turn-helix domain-containing protein n=1 Tax=Pseudobacillus wudalianchiensis TaxID=1743143 RepID=UPI0024809B2F|nr:helix-turn-helix domain-containing protein [Bacillus wudalianchiensis]
MEELARKQEKKLGLTTTEAAKFLGVSRSTLHKLVKEGTIPAIQGTYRGRQIFYINPIDLEQFAGENAAYLQSERLKRRDYYDKERNIAFFQKFSTKEGREARLVFDSGGRWHSCFPTRMKSNLMRKEFSKKN